MFTFIPMSGSLVLRPAALRDSQVLWEWRNAPEVRGTALNTDPIPRADHERWLVRKLGDPACLLLIAEDENVPVGQVRFDIDETGREAEVSVSVQQDHRGRGLGRSLIEGGVRIAAADGIRTVHAYIKPENEPSVMAFRRAGFVAAGHSIIRGAEVLHYIWHHNVSAGARQT